MEQTKETRYIVRIMNKDLNGRFSIFRALLGIKGIGQRTAHIIALIFEKETGIPTQTIIGEIPEAQDKILEDIIVHPEKYGIPDWNLNRQKDFESGENHHLVMADLDFALRKDLQRLNEIKSYRGLRHSWGLTVRGQKTKSTHRGKGGVVGVLKKDAKTAQKSSKGTKGSKDSAPKGKKKK
ncbi:30S ribosomal protein S13 [Candidatus Micrarchaeota archaeon]|nr:30S ribosomal protein S13 [Candidatus Micrarchaeota archaeon]MBU1930919.1 30S ribosomal protein S13 [Candidatus Micrarchaeota archaeon]